MKKEDFSAPCQILSLDTKNNREPRTILAEYWNEIQVRLFPYVSDALGAPLTSKLEQVISILEVARIESHISNPFGTRFGCRPMHDRRCLGRAYVVKAVYDLPTTECLIELLRNHSCLRAFCGWECPRDIPSASTFSRAFAEFSKEKLCDRVHEAMVLKHLAPRTVKNVSRDSTAVAARERAAKKPKKGKNEKDAVEKDVVTSDLAAVETQQIEVLDSRAPSASSLPPDALGLFPSDEAPQNGDGSHCDSNTPEAQEPKPKQSSTECILQDCKRKRGRPKKGEKAPPPPPKRLEVQRSQSAEVALLELSKCCDWGTKTDTGGHKYSWKGYKTHIDWASGMLPITVVTTSASVHDSQLAIPMARITAKRVKSEYALMDSAYDASQIRIATEELGVVPIIDPNPRRGGVAPQKVFDADMIERYKDRSTAERGNGRLKDEFGLRRLRVRGHAKAHAHIMFGIIALFADQILKLHCS